MLLEIKDEKIGIVVENWIEIYVVILVVLVGGKIYVILYFVYLEECNFKIVVLVGLCILFCISDIDWLVFGIGYFRIIDMDWLLGKV